MLDAWCLELYPPPPLANRTKADYCGLSAFFKRTILHFADNQPLASPKPRLQRRLIPMVRKTAEFRSAHRRVRCGVRELAPAFLTSNLSPAHCQFRAADHAPRNTQHAPRLNCQRATGLLLHRRSRKTGRPPTPLLLHTSFRCQV